MTGWNAEVHLEYHVAWCLDTVTSATGFVIYLKTNCHLDDSPLCAITLTG